MKRLMTCLAAVAAVLSLQARPAKEGHLRILYWNIQNGMWAGQEDNYDAFTDWVKALEPDICVWCEASTLYRTGTDELLPKRERYLPGHWGEVAARYGHSCWVVSAERDNYPQVVTSRYPLESVEELYGNGTDTVVVHGSGWVRTVVGGKEINLVTVHLKPFLFGYKVPKEEKTESAARFDGEYWRIREAEYIFDHTVRTRPAPDKENWLMLGDFNARSRVDNFKYRWSAYDKRFLLHDHIALHSPYVDLLSETSPEVFQATHSSDTRIDFVYVTVPVLKAVRSARVVRDSWSAGTPSGVGKFYRPSDHLPILIDIKTSQLK
ncbi:MAG: endonuclease [Bacteroidales bacterium]|nr:endonuclease [Bacteroidales bacterium]